MGLTFIYFCANVLFVYAGQANFWTERRKAVKDRATVLQSYSATVNKENSFKNSSTVARAHSSTFLLAQLPANMQGGGPAQILDNLNNSALAPKLSASISKSVQDILPQGFEKKYNHILRSLPYSYGQVRNITLPTGKPNGQTIIHIQDVHMNPEAQENIAKTLQELLDKKVANLVALEGAFGHIDINRFRSFPNREDIRTAADYMLRVNKISGAIHTALTSIQDIPPFVGIDDNKHYWANVEAYKQSAAKVKEYKELLADLTEDLANQKAQILNKDLLTFDTKVEAYRKGKISLGEYIIYLNDQARGSRRLQPAYHKNMSLFLQAFELESALDFKKIDKERTALINKLTENLDKKEIAQLLNFSVTYRTGQIRYTDFYQFLQNLCRNNKIALGKFPAMQSYIKYVLISDKINAENLFKEVNLAEENLYASLIKTKEENELIDKSKLLILTGKLLDFSLTPEEWEEYKSLSPLRSLRSLGLDGNNLNKNSRHREPNELNEPNGLSLSSFEAFYREANIRDIAMADNFKKAMETHKATIGVVITGGFHSCGLEKHLSEAGATVITFTPKITKVDTENGSAYLSVFAQEKTPLEKLFEGDKLFVSPLQFDVKTTLHLATIISAISNNAEKTFKYFFPKSRARVKGLKVGNVRKITLTEAGNGVSLIIRLSGKTIKSVVEKIDKPSLKIAMIGLLMVAVNGAIQALNYYQPLLKFIPIPLIEQSASHARKENTSKEEQGIGGIIFLIRYLIWGIVWGLGRLSWRAKKFDYKNARESFFKFYDKGIAFWLENVLLYLFVQPYMPMMLNAVGFDFISPIAATWGILWVIHIAEYVILKSINVLDFWVFQTQKSPRAPPLGNVIASGFISAVNIYFGLSPLHPFSFLLHFLVNLVTSYIVSILKLKAITRLLDHATGKDAYVIVQEAFLKFNNLVASSQWPVKTLSLLLFRMFPHGEIHLESLIVIMHEAHDVSSKKEALSWVLFLTTVASIRKAWDRYRLPGIFDFLQQYRHDSTVGRLVQKSLKRVGIGTRSEEEGHAMQPEEVANLVMTSKQYDGKDLVTVARVAGSYNTNEFILLLKPPASFNHDTINAIVKRLGHFGYQVAGIRVYDGTYFIEHPEIIASQYREAWEGYRHGIKWSGKIAEIRRLYDTFEFRQIFGETFKDEMVIPGQELKDRFGVTDEEIMKWWEQGEHPIPVEKFESMYSVKVNDLNLPRELFIETSEGHAINWFPSGRAFALNKIGSGTSIFPFKDPKINGGKPLVVVNGYVPGLLKMFQQPETKTIVFLVRKREDIIQAAPWAMLRNQFLGDNNVPSSNPSGSIRRDAFTGKLPIKLKDTISVRQNVAHLSAGPLEGLCEIHTLMGHPILEISFGHLLHDAGYSESHIRHLMDNPTVRIRNLSAGAYDNVPLFQLTRNMEPLEALTIIKKYSPPFRESNPEYASTVTFSEFLELKGKHEKGELSVKTNHEDANAIRKSSNEPIYFPGIDPRVGAELNEEGIKMFQDGQVAVIDPAGGTGGRFGGYNLPESHPDRQKVLAKVLEVDGAYRNAIEVRSANILWWKKNHEAVIPFLPMANELNREALEHILRQDTYYGLDETLVDTYQQNGIYRLNPSRDDLIGKESTTEEIIASNGEPGEIFRTDDGQVSLKPAGHVEIIAQLVLNRKLLKLAKRGVEILVTANGDDVGFLIDPAKFAHFSRSPEQMMIALAKRHITYIFPIEGQRYKIVMRDNEVIETDLPAGHEVRVKEDGLPEVTQEGTGINIKLEKREIESGGYMVDLRGKDGTYRPVILERTAFPHGLDTENFLYFNTGQMYFKTHGLLKLFDLSDLDEYERMSQNELANRVRQMLERLPIYVEVKDVIVSKPSVSPVVTRKAAQLTRVIGTLSHLLDTTFILIDRTGQEGIGGYRTLKEREDAGSASKMIAEIKERTGMFEFQPPMSRLPLSIADPLLKALVRSLEHAGWKRMAKIIDGIRQVYNVTAAPYLETYSFLHLVMPFGLNYLIGAGFFGFLTAHAVVTVIFNRAPPKITFQRVRRQMLNHSSWALVFLMPYMLPFLGIDIFTLNQTFNVVTGLHVFRNFITLSAEFKTKQQAKKDAHLMTSILANQGKVSLNTPHPHPLPKEERESKGKATLSDILNAVMPRQEKLNVGELDPRPLRFIGNLSDDLRRDDYKHEFLKALAKEFESVGLKELSEAQVLESILNFVGYENMLPAKEVVLNQIKESRELNKIPVIKAVVRRADLPALREIVEAQREDNAINSNHPSKLLIVPAEAGLEADLKVIASGPDITVMKKADVLQGNIVVIDLLDSLLNAWAKQNNIPVQSVSLILAIPKGFHPNPEAISNLPKDSPFRDAFLIIMDALIATPMKITDFNRITEVAIFIAQQA